MFVQHQVGFKNFTSISVSLYTPPEVGNNAIPNLQMWKLWLREIMSLAQITNKEVKNLRLQTVQPHSRFHALSFSHKLIVQYGDRI